MVCKVNEVDTKDYHGWTPLHNAVKGDHKEICKLLIAKGADVNVKDKNGMTPLHKAALIGNSAICEMLIAEMKNIDSTGDFSSEMDKDDILNSHQKL